MDTSNASIPTFVVVSIVGALCIAWRASAEPSLLPDLPIVGYNPKQWFGWPRALYSSFSNYRALYDEAYKKYLSQGKSCIVPELNDTQVMLPSSLGQWLVDQPESKMSARERQQDFLQTQHTFPVPKMARVPHHIHIVKTDLTRKLSSLSGDVWEELGTGFGVYWGTDTTEWKEVNVFETMMKIVTRTSNRIFVGKEACQNEEYLSLCTAFAQDVPLTGIAIRLIPGFLQQVLAPIITIPNRYHTNKIRKILAPEILRRLKIEEGAENEPNDFLQWFVNYARKSLEPEESTPKYIADRMATINFAAIHTSTFTSANAIYDILSSPEKDEILSIIESEAGEVVPQDNSEWTKASVSKMVKTDSMLRESMRISSFATSALNRVVKAKDGITTPDGLHIKCGNVVAVPALPVHLDPKTYNNPTTYEPLRFVQRSTENRDGSEDRKTRSFNTVDTSLEFLTFGHGRHGCPGRFFAANEMKLLLAYMALHYDIEPLDKRPAPISYGSVLTPDPTVKIRIRRKSTRV